MTDPTPAKKTAPAKKTGDQPLTFAERAALNNAPAWRPEPGGEFHGKLIGVRRGGSDGEKDYGFYPVLVLRDNATDQFIAVHCFHSVLVERLAEIKPKKGDVLHGVYHGEMTTNATKDLPEKDRTTYHSYYVEREGDDTTGLSEEWSTFGS